MTKLFETEIYLKGAEFSACRTRRYLLWRIWDVTQPMLTVIGLNPSTADENTDDPTIRRCIGFAKRWGHGGLWMLNLFAYRSTDPGALKYVDDPIGEHGNHYLMTHATDKAASMVLAAWGVHGRWLDRQRQAWKFCQQPLHCLGVTKDGSPRHPLYVRGDQRPVEWNLPRTAV